MSTVNLSEVARFLESGINLGRRPVDCLHLLKEDELTAVINSFLRANAPMRTIKLGLAVGHNDRVNAIKMLRSIVKNCSLLEAKNFVECAGELTVTDQQLTELRRAMAHIIAK
jgi:ribosomal protein L7/L12